MAQLEKRGVGVLVGAGEVDRVGAFFLPGNSLFNSLFDKFVNIPKTKFSWV
jgi:hypothetical protein